MPSSAWRVAARDAPLPPRAQAARRLPAGDAVLGADVRVRGDSADDRACRTCRSPTRISRPCRASPPPARRCSIGLDPLPQSINLWRCTLHWIGGIGIIVLAVAVLPLLGVGGMQLYKAETPGPGEGREAHAAHHRDRQGAVVRLPRDHRGRHRRAARRRHELVRRDLPLLLRHRARRLLAPTTRASSYFNSAVDRVGADGASWCSASLNFARHFMAFRTLSLQPYRSDSEGKAILITLGVSVAWSPRLLWIDRQYPDFAQSLRHAAFTVVSIATTTGFVTENYEKWPAFSRRLAAVPELHRAAAPAPPAAASRCSARCCWCARRAASSNCWCIRAR